MGADQTTPATRKTSDRTDEHGTPNRPQRDDLPSQNRNTVAGFAGTVREVGNGLQSVVAVARCGNFAAGLGSVAARSGSARGSGMGDALSGQHDGARTPTRGRGKKSTAASEALGRSRGGFTTKVHVRVDGKGRLFTFVLTPGQRHDSIAAETLMRQGAIRSGRRGRPRLRPRRLVADKAYGSRPFKQFLRRRGIQPVIPRKRNQKRGRPHNAALYRERNRVERFINRLKQFRAVATRYDKRAASYSATVLLAAIVLCL